MIALALATKKDAPKTTGPEADADQLIGESEGLARQGQVEQALQMVKKPRFSTQVHFRAFVGVAAAAVEAKSPEAGSVVGEALTYLEGKKRIPSDLSWEIRRLMELGQRAGVAEDRLKTMAGLIPDPALRGRAELGLFRAQLDRGKDAVEEGAAEQVVPNGSVAQLLAFEAVARHNTRRDPDWAKAVAGWEEPRKAFGFLGVALGLQDRGKGH